MKTAHDYNKATNLYRRARTASPAQARLLRGQANALMGFRTNPKAKSKAELADVKKKIAKSPKPKAAAAAVKEEAKKLEEKAAEVKEEIKVAKEEAKEAKAAAKEDDSAKAVTEAAKAEATVEAKQAEYEQLRESAVELRDAATAGVAAAIKDAGAGGGETKEEKNKRIDAELERLQKAEDKAEKARPGSTKGESKGSRKAAKSTTKKAAPKAAATTTRKAAKPAAAKGKTMNKAQQQRNGWLGAYKRFQNAGNTAGMANMQEKLKAKGWHVKNGALEKLEGGAQAAKKTAAKSTTKKTAAAKKPAAKKAAAAKKPAAAKTAGKGTKGGKGSNSKASRPGFPKPPKGGKVTSRSASTTSKGKDGKETTRTKTWRSNPMGNPGMFAVLAIGGILGFIGGDAAHRFASTMPRAGAGDNKALMKSDAGIAIAGRPDGRSLAAQGAVAGIPLAIAYYLSRKNKTTPALFVGGFGLGALIKLVADSLAIKSGMAKVFPLSAAGGEPTIGDRMYFDVSDDQMNSLQAMLDARDKAIAAALGVGGAVPTETKAGGTTAGNSQLAGISERLNELPSRSARSGGLIPPSSTQTTAPIRAGRDAQLNDETVASRASGGSDGTMGCGGGGCGSCGPCQASQGGGGRPFGALPPAGPLLTDFLPGLMQPGLLPTGASSPVPEQPASGRDPRRPGQTTDPTGAPVNQTIGSPGGTFRVAPLGQRTERRRTVGGGVGWGTN